MLTIILTVLPEDLKYLSRHKELAKYLVLTDSNTRPLNVARRTLMDQVTTEFTLCLDADTFLPDDYIEEAINHLIKYPDIDCVALYYTDPRQKHPAFGTSIWRTKRLQALYDWDGMPCECRHMWHKARMVTLPMEAIHSN